MLLTPYNPFLQVTIQHLFEDLFSQKNDIDGGNAGLLSSRSLNYALQALLSMENDTWSLAMIDIGSVAPVRIEQFGTTIGGFCSKLQPKLKACKCNNATNDNRKLFGVLINCSAGLFESEIYMLRLMNEINSVSNDDETVSISIAKMNKWETFDEWKTRAIKNIQKIKQKQKQNAKHKSTKNDIYSDIDVDYSKPQQNVKTSKNNTETIDAKEQKDDMSDVIDKLGSKDELDAKMIEIASDEESSKDWIVALMSIDESENDNNDNGREQLQTEHRDKVEKEILKLFGIFDHGNKKDDMKYFGYKLSGGDVFGMILFDLEDDSKCIPGHDLLEILLDNIKNNCSFTVSIGYSKLMDDDLGLTDEWLARANVNLKQAKKNGKNQIYFGKQQQEQTITSITIQRDLSDTDTEILQMIEVWRCEIEQIASIAITDWSGLQ